jgi:hypothetical protein
VDWWYGLFGSEQTLFKALRVYQPIAQESAVLLLNIFEETLNDPRYNRIAAAGLLTLRLHALLFGQEPWTSNTIIDAEFRESASELLHALRKTYPQLRKFSADGTTDAVGKFYQDCPYGVPFLLEIAYALMGANDTQNSRKLKCVETTFPVIDATSGSLLRFVFEECPYLRPGEIVLNHGQADLEFDEGFRSIFIQTPRILDSLGVISQQCGLRVSILSYNSMEQYAINRLHRLCGNSGTGAFAIGLVAICRGFAPDGGIVSSFALNEYGDCSPVGGATDKLRLIARHPNLSLLLADEQRQTDPGLSGAADVGEGKVHYARSFSEALDLATGRSKECHGYLTSLITHLEQANWKPVSGPSSVSGLFVPATVERIVNRPMKISRDLKDMEEKVRSLTFEHPVLAWEDYLFGSPEVIKRAIIVAKSGGGKSFLSVWSTLQIAAQSLTSLNEGKAVLATTNVPVYLPAPLLAIYIAKYESMETALIEAIRDSGFVRSPSTFLPWFAEHLHSGHCWIFIDGMDHIPHHLLPGFIECIKSTESGGPFHILITCSEDKWNRVQIPWRGIDRLRLMEWNESSIQCFTSRWFSDSGGLQKKMEVFVRSNEILNELFRVPLIATMGAMVFESESFALLGGVTETILCRETIEMLMSRAAGNEESLSLFLSGRKILSTLSTLAFSLYIDEKYGGEYPEVLLLRSLNDIIGRDPVASGWSADAILRICVENYIMERSSRDTIAFYHSIFQEYLAGLFLADVLNAGLGWDVPFTERLPGVTVREFTDAAAWESRWEPVLRFFAGSIHNNVDKVQMLKLLIAEDKADLLKTRLAVAAACLPDMMHP